MTDDYTQEERREIKRWVDMAKQRTKSEISYEWKVRGSPRSGLQLVKMKIWNKQEATTSRIEESKESRTGKNERNEIRKERTKISI